MPVREHLGVDFAPRPRELLAPVARDALEHEPAREEGEQAEAGDGEREEDLCQHERMSAQRETDEKAAAPSIGSNPFEAERVRVTFEARRGG